MANYIARAVEQANMGPREKLKGSGATTQFQASAQRADIGNNGFAEAMNNFVKAGTSAYGAYKEKSQKDAQAKSDEIIRTMTPAQRREAIGNGTLLAQDDPDVMNILRHDTGRTAAFDVENEMQTKIANGEFDQKDRAELEEYRQTRLAMVAESYATEAGINPTDPDYQKGFNTNIVDRNAGLYDLHEQRRSKRFIAQSVINTRGDVGGLLTDVTFMKSPDAGAHMANYFNTKYESGGIPTDQAMIDSINQTVSDAQNRDHGTSFLTTFGDQEVTVMGIKQKVRDIVGEEKYQNLIVKSGANAYARNRPKFEKFQVDLATAMNQVDPVTAANMIDKVDTENQWIQDSADVTPQKQAIINARIAIQDRIKADSAATLKATETAIQTDNRLLALDEKYEQRMAGASVDLSKKGMAVDANTGEYKESDWATYADQKLKQINAMGISEEQKDALKGKLIAADFEGGPFQRQFQTLIDDASREWTGAVTLGEPGDFTRITELQRVYAQQPSLIASLYPEKAGFIEKMHQMSASGIEPRVLIEADKKDQGLSREEKMQRDVQWAALKSDPANKDLSAIPDDMDVMARALYDSFVAGTGQASEGSRMLSEWLSKNTVSFIDDDDDIQSSYRGMLNKKDLMADPADANSWEAGKAIVDELVTGIKANDQYWADSPVRIEKNRKGAITITSLTGQQVVINREAIQAVHLARKQAAVVEKAKLDTDELQRKQQQYNQVMKGGRGPL